MMASSECPGAPGCAQKWIGLLGTWNSTVTTVMQVWASTAATMRSSPVSLGGDRLLLPPVMYMSPLDANSGLRLAGTTSATQCHHTLLSTSAGVIHDWLVTFMKRTL